MSESLHKILFVCTEDWFFRSHFLPLVEAARAAGAGRIALATTINGQHEEITRMGVEIIPLDFERAAVNGMSALRVMGRLRTAISRWQPDIVHFIALKPILLGGLVMMSFPRVAQVYHVTGLGTLANGDSFFRRWARQILFRLPGVYARRSNASLIFENPDDAACLQRYGLPKGADITFVGGAGIDPDQYPPQPHHDRKPVHVAFVGRLLAIKGVDLLVAAIKLLHQNGIEVVLDIYGVPDPANPTSYSLQQIKAWTALPYVQWHGQTADIVAVWNKAAICVVPSRAGDGLPRALLEAASCARPLVVSDVPGCRYFVRNGVEGLVVPPEDVPALAEAIKKLVNNATLRRRMGMAARERVLSQFTKDHIVATVSGIYKDLLCSIKEGGRG